MHPLCELDGRDIDLWAVQLCGSDFIVERCMAILSPDERARAESFLFEHHRCTYVLSRGILRELLGRYVSIPPANIRFSYGSKGKPNLVGVVPSIRFNSSNSANMGLYAMTRNCDLGVDIEKVRPLQDMQQIADQFFCREETRELFSLPLAERELAFFHCWSRKEAYIKAVGDGLSMPLDKFRVTLTPGDPVEFVHLGNDRKVAKEWTLHSFGAIPGYAAALAYNDAPRPLHSSPVMTATEILGLLSSP